MSPSLPAVGFDEFFRLHEHAAGTAAGIVNAAFVGSEHLDEEPHNALRGVELAAFLAFGAGELAEEILVNPAQNVFGTACLIAHADSADKIDEFSQTVFVECRSGVVLGQNAFQSRIVALYGDHRVIDNFPDG